MNLGQMIDPTWVQERFPERFPACCDGQRSGSRTVATHKDGLVERSQIAAPIQAHRTVVAPSPRATASSAAPASGSRARYADRPSPKRDAVLKVMLKVNEPRNAGFIARRAGNIDDHVCYHVLRHLHRNGLVERTGKLHWYLYQITPAGRARVEPKTPRG